MGRSTSRPPGGRPRVHKRAAQLRPRPRRCRPSSARPGRARRTGVRSTRCRSTRRRVAARCSSSSPAPTRPARSPSERQPRRATPHRHVPHGHRRPAPLPRRWSAVARPPRHRRSRAAGARSTPAVEEALAIGLVTAHHQSSSCRMGTADGSAVVDPRLAVHGTRGLMVADASVFPNTSYTQPQPDHDARGRGGAAIVRGER
ncbi:MAG: GMC oxidoreductase [Chloroflexota bacterium]